MTIKYLNLSKIEDRKVVLRTDYNVPLKKNKVADNTKIRDSLATIKKLLMANNQIIIVSHLGRPYGKRMEKFSLRPVATELRKLLNNQVNFMPNRLDSNLVEKIRNSKSKIILLENIRYYKEEKNNTKTFARLLASLGDVYVNDAFAGCHRSHASLVGITKYLPAFAGLDLQEEIRNMEKALHPKKPAIAIIGGVKISTKIGAIKNLLPKFTYILIGGALANTFLAAKGYDCGGALYEKNELKTARNLLRLARNKIKLPVDIIIADKKDFSAPYAVNVSDADEICLKKQGIYDIGPKTIMKYSEIIRKSKTLVWNGPLGFFEQKPFQHGSYSIARLVNSVSNRKTYTVIGGGETIQVFRNSNSTKYLNHISTGGGAMLKYLEGKTLPAIKALETNKLKLI